MKKVSVFKFLLAAAFLCFCFNYTSCLPEPDDADDVGQPVNGAVKLAADDAIIGEWKSPYGEKYSISVNDYDNYYADNLYYSVTDLYIKKVDTASGYIYGKFDDAEHVGDGASVGQWYALYYKNLTANSVDMFQPYKADGKAACDSLDEAISEFTLENKYYNLSLPSSCTK